MTMKWTRTANCGGRIGCYYLKLTFELNTNVLEGSIYVNAPHATFKFPSLGIAGKKIKVTTDEEMQAEAEKFLVKKLEKRIAELTAIQELLNNNKK